MEQPDVIFEKKNTMSVIEQLAEIRHQEGVEEGGEKERKRVVRSLLANTKHSPAKIAELVGVPVALVTKIKKSLSAK
jgi:hypothetical protein